MPSGKPLPTFIVCLILIVVFCVVWFSPIQLWIYAPCQPIHSLTSSLFDRGLPWTRQRENHGGSSESAEGHLQRRVWLTLHDFWCVLSCFYVFSFWGTSEFLCILQWFTVCLMRVSKFLSGSGLNHVVGGRYVIGWKCFPILWGWIHVQGVLKSYHHHFYPIDINVVTDFWDTCTSIYLWLGLRLCQASFKFSRKRSTAHGPVSLCHG